MGQRFTEAPYLMTLFGTRSTDGSPRASVRQGDVMSPRDCVPTCRETIN